MPIQPGVLENLRIHRARNELDLLAEQFPEMFTQEYRNAQMRKIMDRMGGMVDSSEELGGLQLLRMAQQEIVGLRKHLAVIQPKADAYDTLKKAVDMIGGRGEGYPMGRDIVDVIEGKIQDIEKAMSVQRDERMAATTMAAPTGAGRAP